MTMLVRSGAVWFGIMLAAILNGAARDMFLVPLTAADGDDRDRTEQAAPGRQLAATCNAGEIADYFREMS